jgi:hypothetical protein
VLGTGKAARLLGAGLEAGVEAGAEVVGHTIGEAAIQNQELTAEKMAAALGTGALYGGGLGVGLKGTGMLFGGAKNRLAKALARPDPAAVDAVAEGAFGSAAPGLGKRVTDFFADVSAIGAGKPRRTMRDFFELSKEGAERRRVGVFEGDDIVNRLTGDFEEALNKTQAALEATRIGAGGKLKQEHVSRIIRRDNAPQQLLATRQAFEQARDVLDTIVADKAQFYQRNAKKLRQRLDHFTEIVETAAQKGNDVSPAAFTQLDTFKREWQQLTKQARRSKDARAVATHELLRATDDKVFRPLLQSVDTWGDVGKFQELINKAWTEGLSGPVQKMQREMMTRYGRVAGDPYQDAFIARREGIAGYLKNLDNPDKSLQHRAVREYLDFLDSYADASKVLDLSPAERAQWDELRKQAAKLRSYTDEAGETVAAANQFKKVTEDDGSGILGATLGGGVGYALGGEEGMGATIGGAALGAALKPGIAIRRLAAVEQLARQMDGKVSAGMSKIFSKARPAAVKVAAPALRARARAEDRDQRIQAERRQQALESLAGQPEALQADLRSAYAGISGSAPNLAQLAANATQRKLEYLASQLPPPPMMPGLLSPKPDRLSPSEAVAFNRKAAAVEDPYSLLANVVDGALTTDEVEAVQATSPEALNDVRARALADVAELQERGETLPYETMGQLSTLLGVPMVAAHDPMMAAAAQAAFAASAAAPPPPMAPRPREQAADYASEMRTPREQLGQVEA